MYMYWVYESIASTCIISLFNFNKHMIVISIYNIFISTNHLMKKANPLLQDHCYKRRHWPTSLKLHVYIYTCTCSARWIVKSLEYTVHIATHIYMYQPIIPAINMCSIPFIHLGLFCAWRTTFPEHFVPIVATAFPKTPLSWSRNPCWSHALLHCCLLVVCSDGIWYWLASHCEMPALFGWPVGKHYSLMTMEKYTHTHTHTLDG